MTVLGPVAAEALGVTDAHSHLYIAPVPGGAADAPVLTDIDGVARELALFREMGGGAIVDCQPGGCGRDGRVLRELSERTGIHVVAATGFHRRVYYPADAPLFDLSAERAGDIFRGEIRDGLEETRLKEPSPQPSPGGRGGRTIYPGIIKIAAEATLDASPLALFEAAAEVCRETGYAIEMHTERGASVETFLAFFGGRGVSPRRLVFCHVDKRPDFGLHRELAQTGVLLEYDTFFRPKYEPERGVWPLLERMTAAGLAGQVALAMDMADPSLWAELGGGPGLAGIFTIIKSRLEQVGLPDETIRALLGGNIAMRIATRNEL
jgi:phosphotriesterase-related protein